MQGLAKMANRIRSAIVLVQQAAAAGEIQQRQAKQSRANSLQLHTARVFAEYSHRLQQVTPLHGTLDAR